MNFVGTWPAMPINKFTQLGIDDDKSNYYF
jgi:hypothetical protein